MTDRSRLLLAGLLVLSLPFVATQRSWSDEPPVLGSLQSQKLDRTVHVTMDYLIYLPKDYSDKNSWPLMLFLHGAGERGHDLNRVKAHGPPKLIAAGQDFPMIVVSPQCPSDHWWRPNELNVLLDDIVEKYQVDQDRIYLTGLSMGGFGTWRLAAYAPERFAALVPICGGGEAFAARRIAHLPVWAFHGAKDSVVPLSASETMVDALRKAKGNIQFTIYPDADHDAWTETYNNPELYTWLLQQKRASR